MKGVPVGGFVVALAGGIGRRGLVLEHFAADAHARAGQVVEYKVQYDGTGTEESLLPTCSINKTSHPPAPFTAPNCTITINVTKDMSPPVYVYYELDNFYQNHRRYVKSRSDAQLKGGANFPNAPTTDCDPLKEINGKKLWPCGLIANSMFNGAWAVGRVCWCCVGRGCRL